MRGEGFVVDAVADYAPLYLHPQSHLFASMILIRIFPLTRLPPAFRERRDCAGQVRTPLPLISTTSAIGPSNRQKCPGPQDRDDGA